MDYQIIGGNLPVVVCKLARGEKMFSEVGGRSWVKGRVETETKAGSVGSAIGRMFSGESLFMSYYTALDDIEIAFASSFPGSIRAYELAQNETIICQKRAFLAATETVSFKTHMQKKMGAGFFGGEGFILQQMTGPGTVFIEIDGHAVDYDLQVGEELVCDTGVMAVMEASNSLDIVSVKGLKNMFLGGEGLFDTVIKGPGKVTLQSMTVHGLARVVAPFIASK